MPRLPALLLALIVSLALSVTVAFADPATADVGTAQVGTGQAGTGQAGTADAGVPETDIPDVEGRYASIVVDADSLEVLHARQIDELRYPASLTKVMTILMLLDALEAGEVTLGTEMEVSETAAGASPVKLYLKAGTTITVEDAILGLAVKSANDAAVVVAEHLSGSVDRFAQDMTARAQGLGMKSTVFKTPNGLPDPGQVTTARDMAKLASAVLRTYPEHYHYFGRKTFAYRGATYRNTNGLLHALPDVDGFKTGFTNASGYNLIISAEREDAAGAPRRVIAVVMGGASGRSRNTHMSDLLNRAFARMGIRPVVSAPGSAPGSASGSASGPVSEPVSEPEPKPRRVADAAPASETPNVINALSLRRSDGSKTTVTRSGGGDASLATLGTSPWAVRVGRFNSMPAAHDQLTALIGLDPALTAENAVIQPLPARGGRALFEARFKGLGFEGANAVCAKLSAMQGGCGLVAPSRPPAP